MAPDDRLRRVQEAGADFLEAARARAEEFLKELSRAGEDTSGRAHGALDEIIEGSRKGTEQLVSSIRKEINVQLRHLGVATKEDLADLEKRVAASTPKPAPKPNAGRPTGATKAPARKSAADEKSTPTSASKRAAAQRSTAKRAATTKRAPTTRPAG
ncbi:MAG: hypothetical protein JO337_13165 [Acidimicrobiales bacterium]|nr:hypothetical protein [Acidimicrobiales bacterium]